MAMIIPYCEPLLSVVVPVFNRQCLLVPCLESVSRQTLRSWECIVVDDGSSDSSLVVARSFAAKDSRFKALSRTRARKGAAACRNEGLASATGKLVMFLDSDDLLSENCLARRAAAFAQHPDCDFVTFPVEGFTDNPGAGRRLFNVEKPLPDLLRFLRLDNPWPINGPLWKREALMSGEGFDQSLPGWQDWQLHVMALLAGKRYAKIGGEPDSFIRIKGDDRIGHGAWTIDHVRPKAAFLLRLFDQYRGQLQADLVTRGAAAGLAWHLIARLQELGFEKVATAYWTHLWKWKYLTFPIWYQGILALRLHGRPGGGICWSLVARWPKTLVGAVDTSTVMCVSF